MHLLHLTTLSGWAAVGLGVVATFVQWRRVSTEGVAGVSLATWTLFVLLGWFWVSYGVVARSPEVILGSLMCLPLQSAILFRLAPWRHRAVIARSAAYFALSCVVPSLRFGWTGGVYGTGVAMTITRLPQLLELVRHREADGVSAASWYVGAGGCALWIYYYSGARLWAALTATAVAGVANLSIAALATWRHRQARQRLIAETVFAF
ncbi:MAG: hypothetical protein KGJ36_08925 [Acidobacteriota bacterium]|nr:hypothetical protein [Acidobacteriota bacterium]